MNRDPHIKWSHAYGALLVLLVLWILNWTAYAFCLWQFTLHPNSYSWEFLAGTFENNQSEVFQVWMTGVVLSWFIWKGNPDAKQLDETEES